MNCDNCKHYHWYYDWCSKWDCEVDARSTYSCFEQWGRGGQIMYNELIEDLRENHDKYFARDMEAANAIEELSMKLHGDEAAIAGMKREIERMVVAGKQRWIPVTERLPEDGKFVIVCNDDGHMMIAKHETETYEWYYKYTNYDFDIWDNEEQGPVRYWMPLPEPPKETEVGE